MDSLFDQVLTSFSENDWAHEMPPGDAAVVESSFEAHHTTVNLHVQVFAEVNAVSVVARCGIVVTDPDARIKVAELLMRTNMELTFGNFELQWEAGETLFRLTNIFAPGAYHHEIFTGLVESAVVEVDRVFPCIRHISQAAPEEIPGLDVQQLLAREEWLPPVDD